MRGTIAFHSIGTNFKNFVKLLLTQNDGLPWNSIREFGTVYLWAAPFALLGIFSCLKNRETYKRLMLIWLICAFVLGCLIDININRINFIFIPLIYFIAEGVLFLIVNFKPSVIPISLAFIISFGCFLAAYFGKNYTSNISILFYDGFGEAVEFADQLEKEVVIEGGSYTLVLFFDQTNPIEFAQTVDYGNRYTEFRPVMSFGKWTFASVSDYKDENVYIVKGEVENTRILRKQFGNFTVVYSE
jgi:lipoprotein signal peptidase